ncbi:MAG TPA: UPF0182 family protein, partial [bacterium]|nr:UPF0182 family protein [bacterium]
IAESLLYIEPLYLQAQGSALPELKRVIVAYGARIAMEPTLEDAVARIFGATAAAAPPASPPGGSPHPSGPSPSVPPAPQGGSPRVAALVAEANTHYARAQAALRAGDFATYGKEIDALGRALGELRRITGTP